MIEITEVVQTATWATVRCSGYDLSVQANVWTRGGRRRIGFNEIGRFNAVPELSLERGQIEVTVAIFAGVVRRIQDGREPSMSGGEFQTNVDGHISFVTDCGERRRFLIDDLVALAEWAQEPDPS